MEFYLVANYPTAVLLPHIVPAAAHSYLLFPRKPLRGAVNGMTGPPCSIGSGAQICPIIRSIHMLRGGVGSRELSLFALLILFDMACHTVCASVTCSAITNP